MAKAAQQLAITQPVVSKAIAELENTLGVRLLDRSSKGIEPTVYGQTLAHRSIAVFNDLRGVVSELENLSDPTAGELRVGCSDALASGMLGAVINRLSQKHPRLKFEVVLGGGLTDLPYGELRGRSIDLIIGRFPSPMPDDMESELLFHEEVFVVSGMANPMANRRKLSLAKLIDQPWCLPSLETFPWTRIADAFQRNGLELPSRIVTTRSIMLQTNMVVSGNFLTMLPGSMLHFRAKSMQLKVLPVSVPIQPYPVGVVTLKERTLTPVTKLLR